MRVDFYQLSRDPVEQALPLIARNVLNLGGRLLVVASDTQQRQRISEALWTKFADNFLAHGDAGGEHDARQPILLSDQVVPANAATYLALADGLWREAEGDLSFDRTFYFFDEETLQAARDCWRMLGTREGVERHFWKQQGGKWVEGP